jgi:hypothetical protein
MMFALPRKSLMAGETVYASLRAASGSLEPVQDHSEPVRALSAQPRLTHCTRRLTQAHPGAHPGSPRRSPTHHRGTHPPLTHGSPMALTRLPHRSSTCSSSMPRHIQWDFKSVRMPTTNFSPWVRGHFPRGTVLHTPSTICFVLSTIRIIGESCFAVPPPYYQSKLSWCSFTSGISR